MISHNFLDSIFKNTLIVCNLQNYKEYKYTFTDFVELLNSNNFKKPIYQTSVDNDKINEMMESYKTYPDFFYFKNKIVLSYVPSEENNIYIMDGQHRIELIKNLNLINYNDYVYICCYIIDDENKMKLLFDELNKDSYKNHNYVFLDDFSKNLHNKFTEYLETNYSIYFESKKKKEAYRKTISEFLNGIVFENYLLKFNNFEELKRDFESANFQFNWTIKYKDLFNNNNKLFYKDEYDCVNSGIIFTLKNNNFNEYLLNRKIVPSHKFKKDKKRISKKLKKEVWLKEFGNKKTGKCPYKNCKNTITENDYSCGHIISEYNGGETDINNLKPMCYGCNNRLGKRNWIL
jgi:5-methylcytosine-specific restriction endonuclease McrA